MESTEQGRIVQVAATAFFVGLLVGFGACWYWLEHRSRPGLVEVGPTGRTPGSRVTVQSARPAGPVTHLTAYRNRVGESLLFSVTGATEGTIWGSDVYTDDSPLPVTAVHFGALQPGEKGLVRVTILPGAESYTGSTKNGVTSQSYQKWDGSYSLQRVTGPATEPVIELPAAAMELRVTQGALDLAAPTSAPAR
jgi:hypothetical protein